MNVLFIAPLPPPITGQALASEVLLRELSKNHSVELVNYHRGDLERGLTSFRRIPEGIAILGRVLQGKRRADAIYLTITQSLAGNIKDLLIYLACLRDLSRMVVHLHGGGLRKELFDRYRLLRRANRFFLSRVGRVVVLGKSLSPVFEGMVPGDRIRIVPNFAEAHLFVSREEVRAKFREIGTVRVLFLSNLIEGKGHEELADAFLGLGEDRKRAVRIDFAGGFESAVHRDRFLQKIKGEDGLRYLGVAGGEEKKRLLADSHLLCLPTYYPYEGQPISILEGYASGCAVIATDHGGIRDIFRDGENGFLVPARSALPIRERLAEIAVNPGILLPVALHNREAAESYREEIHLGSMIRILEEVAGGMTGTGA